MKTIIVLHTFATPAGELTEVHRLVTRGAHNFESDPIPVLFEGNLYTPVPRHLVSTGYGAREGADVVLVPYALTVAYDFDFDEIAPRLYSPAEADELVERVRFPLERVVKGARSHLQGTEDPEYVREIEASEKLLAELAGVPKRGGPEVCPRRCTECEGPGDDSDGPLRAFVSRHHFSEALTEDLGPLGDENREHPAAKLGWEAWYTCKHCPAWTVELPNEEG